MNLTDADTTVARVHEETPPAYDLLLSGGGFRATLFHLGFLRALVEAKWAGARFSIRRISIQLSELVDPIHRRPPSWQVRCEK